MDIPATAFLPGKGGCEDDDEEENSPSLPLRKCERELDITLWEGRVIWGGDGEQEGLQTGGERGL